MQFAGFRRLRRGNLLNYANLHLAKLSFADSLAPSTDRVGRKAFQAYSTFGAVKDDDVKGLGKIGLAKDLAFVVEESLHIEKERTHTRMELKRLIELRIKKRVREQYVNGKFQDLMKKVIANPETLEDAYNSIRINSNVDLACKSDGICFESLAEELLAEAFDIRANVFSISTKNARKEVLVLPNLKLKVIQEAIRIVLEVVYRPCFSKISHGCRSGRGHVSALKYIRKAIQDSDWAFSLLVQKKVDNSVLAKLLSVIEDRVEDPCLFAIVRSMFDAQVLNLEFGGFPKGHGLPQEGVLSPILMNIYLDLFDREFFRISMRFEVLFDSSTSDEGSSLPKLRNWFRRQLKGSEVESGNIEKSGLRVHACRFMDEMIFSVSGSKDVALKFKLEVENYLLNSLHLELETGSGILPCDEPHGIRFLGILFSKRVRESPAVRAVHKLKEKVRLFASQKQEAWDAGAVRIGKKWLAHGLRKVKESEIKHLADSSSILSQISRFRKAGMETDHWYKLLMKIWMQDVNAKAANNAEFILSKYIAEPALPPDLRDSFYKFQKLAEEYVASETALTLALLPSPKSAQPISNTEIIAPVSAITKRLLRYGLTNANRYSRPCRLLIFEDISLIIDWFAGIVRRWVRWYSGFDNFDEIRLIISNQVRMSCIRTLSSKLQMHETEVEKQFEEELSRIPSTQEIELELGNDRFNSQAYNSDEALMYGIYYSGLCLLSLARMVSESRPCTCFVMGCLAAAPTVYTLHVMERQKFPGWTTGFASCIHPGLNKRRIGLCKQHLSDLYAGDISLQSIEFGSWK